MRAGKLIVVRGNALQLPLLDESVDLCVTSPPYFALRAYQDGGQTYDGQVGSEATPQEFLEALWAATREMVRVLKPSGSIWVNLGDKYSGAQAQNDKRDQARTDSADYWRRTDPKRTGIPNKSLMGTPWRYAIGCIDQLGLILRAEVIWSKPNGLPESVTDRVRRSHEQWFHFVRQPRYYSAVDEIREPHSGPLKSPGGGNPSVAIGPQSRNGHSQWDRTREERDATVRNPLGRLPGSVWTIATQPLKVPAELKVDHFAAFPSEWPKRIIQGWSPPGICVECGEGRRPVSEKSATGAINDPANWSETVAFHDRGNGGIVKTPFQRGVTTAITGYACACPEPTAPTRPAIVLDPFGGTGTSAHVAYALGRIGISVDLSADYCRVAADRDVLAGRVAKVLGKPKPPPVPREQGSLFDDEGAA